jgi:tRNA dimethylallyltransferase
MPESSGLPLVIALLGPTATGKSAMALEIATSLNAEIISVDSMQVYTGMDIGTAKVAAGLRTEIPHHMIDIVDYRRSFSVADFQMAGRGAITTIASGNKLPFLVGGSGLYFEALVFDYRFPPALAENGVRDNLEDRAHRDPEGLREELREADPEFARSEGFHNLRRVVRAMEVYLTTGRPFSSFKNSAPAALYPWAGAVVDPKRELLYALIDKRVDAMIAAGLVEEVLALERTGPISKTARQALGYKEVLAHLDGRLTLQETANEIKQKSRRYAKRQLTWLRRIAGLQWFELGEEDIANPAAKAREIHEYLERQIKSLGQAADYGAL